MFSFCAFCGWCSPSSSLLLPLPVLSLICLSIHLFIYPSVCVWLHNYMYIHVHPFLFNFIRSVYLSIYSLSICTSTYLFPRSFCFSSSCSFSSGHLLVLFVLVVLPCILFSFYSPVIIYQLINQSINQSSIYHLYASMRLWFPPKCIYSSGYL